VTALLLAAVLAQDGGVYLATRATLEQPDGGIVAFPADGGVVLVSLEPWKAMQLADERQRKDFELTEARKPQPVGTVALVVGAVKLVLDAVPVVLGIYQAGRQP
jgi:hypothetical protein